MRLVKKEFPDVGELVIGTVKKIAEHGAYVYLDEYDLEAFAPTQEIVQSWFHSIRDYVKEGNKTVFKVISVNPKMRVVEVSLKRVRVDEKEKKLLLYRHRVRVLKLLEIAMKKLNRPAEEALKVMWYLEEQFGDPFKVFEEVVKTGPHVLDDLQLDAKLKEIIIELARQQVELPPTKISGIIKIVSVEGDGVEKIKAALIELEKTLREKFPQISTKIYVVGPPRYRIDLTGQQPKQVEAAFSEAANILQALQKKYKVIGNIQRIEQ
ncbi:translation initiation factor IF-2 subunit alpha [Pyrobaculum aerophilum]|uniref:Translation initiation factor 2 subunit alpha n=2 Tax=Pyrobaculum aerophilum TaxID=13773 RepID=IF2A_PYRAE|nr:MULTISPECIES: translation initiation factor IF-2 subunit alpha [Pyrobaculum]Q8ZTY5.1 RecName: Full=Translation initiation factor 2 subunit alpha; AltName: Full=aIF2-alpha; AltName: Full=eIF-2-alpha [Pyrobaculum aerophilum str. IM2]AAL64624.1 translation initiation factor aIF-2 alpha subunit [Pyrobaculum aerophilum str. IM2]MCX8137411.1 translation initiation factor IF-2 subunit alpha [Pyrobaculum aerophilum]HII46142.1 translation initiation factor IF-2 subunit alpha [Pyrobaculum aerophilum]